MGLPHRNSSVLKQTNINQRKVKVRIRMELRVREVDQGGGGLTRASEAKGPFPGGKRVGGKKKQESKSKSKSPWTAFHGSLVLHDESKKENPIHFNEVDGEGLFESRLAFS